MEDFDTEFDFENDNDYNDLESYEDYVKNNNEDMEVEEEIEIFVYEVYL